ncbi:MAG: NAD(P)/FAD-dependent oxidoreductase [Deltaproteobacteria bacterium]
MNARHGKSRRIVVVGGGIAGLAAAVRLAQAGLPVTLLEASELGGAASTRNQGWLRSGALYAQQAPEFARLCDASRHQTLKFCPDCLEPHTSLMTFLFSRPDTPVDPWKRAWTTAGVLFHEVSVEQVALALPDLDRSRIQCAFELPDRSVRFDVLLARLAATAQEAGTDLRTSTPVQKLVRHGDKIEAVVTASGEEIAVQMVVLAGGAWGFHLCSEFLEPNAGSQHEVEPVLLKTHLLAMQPEIGYLPFCIPDADGLNHIPHPQTSVFGTARWMQVSSADDQPISAEIDLLRKKIHEFFPRLAIDANTTRAWAGTTVQAMRVDQLAPGGPLWPTVVDHARYAPHVVNLLSIFPGRATLWGWLAEETRKMALSKLDTWPVDTAHPPWAT